MGMRRKVIVIVMVVIALIIGLVVPFLVIAFTILAALLFKDLDIFTRAILMVFFGLAGLGLGTLIALRILERMRLPPRLKEGEKREGSTK
ncbi:MAG: hypothetical protein LM598_04065 [Candidatus Verstraetearchaeota archaeon]|nr:hypothetical protein [Candidatus Verstraetearchaeota archaeon]